jgi:hypothetical protein
MNSSAASLVGIEIVDDLRSGSKFSEANPPRHMQTLIEDVKEQSLVTKEYHLDDGSGAKAVDRTPVSAAGTRERNIVTGLDDLKVICPHGRTNHVAEKATTRSGQQEIEASAERNSLNCVLWKGPSLSPGVVPKCTSNSRSLPPPRSESNLQVFTYRCHAD